MYWLREIICRFAVSYLRKYSKTQKYARLPNHYLGTLKISPKPLHSKGYLPKIIL